VRAVRASLTIPGTVHAAESFWYDVARWPDWVDGLARVLERSEQWPRPGAVVVWESGPAGRGRVTERVLDQAPLEGLTVQVEDDSIRGRQRVAFSPVDEQRTEVALTLEYELKRRSPLTQVVDLLFIRGAVERSLRTTLARFAAELRPTQPPGVG